MNEVDNLCSVDGLEVESKVDGVSDGELYHVLRKQGLRPAMIQSFFFSRRRNIIKYPSMDCVVRGSSRELAGLVEDRVREAFMNAVADLFPFLVFPSRTPPSQP